MVLHCFALSIAMPSLHDSYWGLPWTPQALDLASQAWVAADWVNLSCLVLPLVLLRILFVLVL